MPDAASPEHRVGLIDQVAARMRAQIVSGAWPVGSRIPTEPELVHLSGVGRNTIREAVQSLVHAGLLERRQGSGTYVISTSELPTAINRHIAGARQRDVLEVRQALEMIAAALAASRRTSSQLEQARQLLGQRAAAVVNGDLEAMVETDLSLHLHIADMAHNEVLAELYGSVLDAVKANVRFNFQHQDEDGPFHEKLVEAIAKRDTDAAARRTQHYLQTFIDVLPEA
ncbi:MAG: FadR family transcriptional regulator [Micrococcales bacterium]|nr:FadR family transcriptional regulator [Micrococcales bacterium]